LGERLLCHRTENSYQVRKERFISVHMIIQAIKVQLVDALASRGDEGRDTLR